MGGLNIGDVFMRVLADMTGFETDVTKQASLAGDKAGKTLGQRLKVGMTAGFSAVGAGAGLVFGVAARGAAELTNAMADFQRETGATQDELESARKSVLELSKTNLQSFDEIARTQAALRTDLGLTQAEAEKATDKFLKYGTATGRDAAEGVKALDDIQDAWNLDSSKSGEIMDKLIASHQKYGGSLTENEASLNKLAPQLQALNLNVDDGISLLNLFAEGGLDASKAQFALNSAIQKLPPGVSLEAFVAHLASIKDPAERARQAIEVFGARGGAGLANVIRPGMKGLDDFAVGMDQAAGATERAAEAIEKTPLNQLKMALRSIAAPAIEAGQAFGPLLLALSQLGGGKLVASVTAALGGLFGAATAKVGPKIAEGLQRALAHLTIPASAFAGPLEAGLEGGMEGAAEGVSKRGLGAKIAKALGTIAIPLVVSFAIAEGLAKLGEEQIDKDAKPKIAALVGTALTDGTKEGLEKSISQLRSIAHNAGRANPTYGAWVEAQIAPLQVQLDKLNGVISTSTEGIGRGVEASLGKGRDDVYQGATTMMGGVKDAVDAAKGTAAAGGTNIVKSLAQGLYDAAIQKQSVVKNAFDLLLSAQKDTMHKAQEIAYLTGILTSKELASGLTDTRESVRVAAQETRAAALARLAELRPNAGNIGKQTNEALAAGLKSKDPVVREQARRTKLALERAITANTKPKGAKAGQDVADGVRTKGTAVYNAGAYLAGKLAAGLFAGLIHSVSFSKAHHTNPPRSGGGLVEPIGRMAGGGAPAVPFAYQVNEKGQELFVPEVRGRIMTAADTRAILSARETPRGETNIVNLETYGLPMRADTPAEVAQAIRRIQTGVLRPRRRLGWT